MANQITRLVKLRDQLNYNTVSFYIIFYTPPLFQHLLVLFFYSYNADRHRVEIKSWPKRGYAIKIAQCMPQLCLAFAELIEGYFLNHNQILYTLAILIKLITVLRK